MALSKLLSLEKIFKTAFLISKQTNKILDANREQSTPICSVITVMQMVIIFHSLSMGSSISLFLIFVFCFKFLFDSFFPFNGA